MEVVAVYNTTLHYSYHLLCPRCMNLYMHQTKPHQTPPRERTTASPTSRVVAIPPRSAVRVPESSTVRTASSTRCASFSIPSEYRNISATQRIIAMGVGDVLSGESVQRVCYQKPVCIWGLRRRGLTSALTHASAHTTHTNPQIPADQADQADQAARSDSRSATRPTSR